MNAKSFNGFTATPSMMKFISKTQNGKVKKSKTLRLTGMYLYELKYPKLIPAMKIPITTTNSAIGRFIACKV